MVFFEIYGKKLKVHIEAKSEKKAKEKVIDSIKFHKIEAYHHAKPEQESYHTPKNPNDFIGGADAINELFSIFGNTFKPK